MPQQIIIEDGRVFVYDRRPLGDAPIEAVKDLLLTPQALFIPNTPRSMAAMSLRPSNETSQILTEIKPGLTTMRFAWYSSEDGESSEEMYEWFEQNATDDNPDYESEATARVYMPYTYLLWGLGNVDNWDNAHIHWTRAYWRPTRLTQTDQRLWPAILPNIASDGDVCWGSVHASQSRGFAQIDELTNGFYTSQRFNADYGWNIPPKYRTYGEWAEDPAPVPFADWALWNSPHVELADVMGQVADQLNIVNPQVWNPPPTVASRAAIRHWFSSLDPNAQRRIRLALPPLPAETSETAE